MYFVVLVVVCILCWYHWRRRKYAALDAVYGQDVVKSYPLLGISYLFFGNNESQLRSVQRLGRVTNQLGGVAGGWFGLRYYLMVSDPVVAELVLKSCLEKDDLYKMIKPFVGNANFVAPVPIWRTRRKNLVHIFSSRRQHETLPIFARTSSILAERLQARANTRQPVRLWDFFTAASMDSVCESVLGVELECQRVCEAGGEQPFLRAHYECMQLVSERVLQPWLHSDLVYRLLPAHRRLRAATRVVTQCIDDIIKMKRQAEKNNNEAHVAEAKGMGEDEGEGEGRTFMEQLISCAGYSDEELREETLVLVVAGMDTSAIAAGFTAMLLARHQDVQTRVYQELQQVLGASERAPTCADLLSLSYLEAVIKEALRLYPPSVTAMRTVTKDVTLPDGVKLVQGCGVMVNIWALHRNPRYWGADAEEFRPERFLAPHSIKHPAQFMPFSYGPRNCPGYKYAMLSLKMTLATLLRRYRVLPPAEGPGSGGPGKGAAGDPIPCTIELLLKASDGFTVHLEPRSNGIVAN